MMYSVKCLVTFFYISNFLTVLVSSELLNHYVDGKSDQTTSLLNAKTSNDVRPLSLKQVLVWQEKINLVSLMTLFNATYVLLDNNLVRTTNTSHTVLSFTRREKIIQISGHQFNNKNFAVIVACFEDNKCNIYKLSNNNSSNFVQTITLEQQPYNVLFFYNKEVLNLVILNRIYIWTGTFFDQIYKLSDDGFVLCTFNSGSSEIVLSLESHHNKKSIILNEITAVNMIQIQCLPNMNDVKSITSYSYKNSTYIVILRNQYSMLYLWKDFELVFLNNYEKVHYKKIVHSYVNNVPIFLIAIHDTMHLYQITNNIKHISDMQIKDSTEILDFTIDEDFNIVLIVTSQNITKMATMKLDVTNIQEEDENLQENELSDCMIKIENRLFALSINNNTINTNSSDHKNKVTRSVFSNENGFTKVINGKLILKNNFHIKNLNVERSISFKKLNAINWTPENWLSVHKKQIINGPVIVKSLIVNNTQLPNNHNFKHMLFSSNQQHRITNIVKCDSIAVNSLRTDKVNDIKISDIYIKNSDNFVKGTKQFKNVIVNTLDTEYLNKENASDILTIFGDEKSRRFKFHKDLHVDTIEVKTVNNVEWDLLYSTAFKVGKDTTINGNVNIHKVKLDHQLVTSKVGGINTKLFLNTATSQSINSTMTFANIDANELSAKLLNEVPTEKFVSFYNADNNPTIIKGRVRIEHMNVQHNLQMNGFMKSMNENERILGTNESDLMQIYNGTVTIIGNLHVNNVKLLNNVTPNIFSQQYNENLLYNTFWRTDIEQVLNTHVELKNGLTVPSIKVGLINDIPFERYMLKNYNERAESNLYFEHLVVRGNLISPKTMICEILANQSVKITGEFNLSGKKTFLGNVGVNTLNTQQINNIRLDEIASKEKLFGAPKFATLVFNNDITSTKTTTNLINNKNLTEVGINSIKITDENTFANLVLRNLTVNHLQVGDLNNVHFNKYVSTLDNIYRLEKLNKLIVRNAVVEDVIEVERINDVLFSNLVNHVNYSEPLHGNYKFASTLFIKDFQVFTVNDIDFAEFTENMLYRNWGQDITGVHFFNTVNVENLVAVKINNYDVTKLVDVSSTILQNIVVPNSLKLSNSIFLKSLVSTNLINDLNQLVYTMNNAPYRYWTSVNITGNVQLFDDTSAISILLTQALNYLDSEKVINGQVVFDHIQASNMEVNKEINNIALHEIVADSVLKSQPDQLISGRKQFIKLTTNGAYSLTDVQIPVINEIYLANVNSSIIHQDAINLNKITGQKTFFNGLQANHIECNKISGILPENLVSLNRLLPIPIVHFDRLIITNDINFNIINNINFNQFIENRLLINGEKQFITAVSYINYLALNGPSSTLPSINKISMDNVVFDTETTLIQSPKFFKTRQQFSNVFSENTNSFNLTDLYLRSVFLDDQQMNITSMTFSKEMQLAEDIIARELNGLSAASVRELLDTESLKMKSNVIYNSIETIGGILQESFSNNIENPVNFLYLEKSSTIQVALPATISAKVTEFKDDILLHVAAEEIAESCGLPENCLCPLQYTFHITSQYSTNLLENKAFQRVHTYYTNNVTINVIVNSISKSIQCRLNNVTSDYTMISWTVSNYNTTSNSYVYPENILGYVNDVTFFERNDYVYIVISREFDAITNSYDVDDLIMRFSIGKDKLDVIQRIPTRQSSGAYVFETVQGIYLIIDSKLGGDNGLTNIYKFNEIGQEFLLLRSILDEACTKPSSFELDGDSIIVLTCQDSVKIFKYYPEFSNYYLFQLIEETHLVSANVLRPDAYGRTSPLLLVSTTDTFSIYVFKHLTGFNLDQRGKIRDLRNLVPFSINEQQFIFCPSKSLSSILNVVTQG